jgi:hypothetical protein
MVVATSRIEILGIDFVGAYLLHHPPSFFNVALEVEHGIKKFVAHACI